MKSKFINVVMFAVGAAIGSAVTHKIIKDRYERIVQEEIESIKQTFAEIPNNDQDGQNDESSDDEDDLGVSHKQINWDELEDLDEEDDDEEDTLIHRYAELTNNYTSEKGGAEKVATDPYVISPYDFGDLDEYDQVSLTYYSDGILEDEDHNIVTDVKGLIGSKALFTFGEYEDDAVFVRNERLRTDYEILKDYRTYEQATGASPNRVDNE